MNRIDRLFAEKKDPVLSIYFTAGYPGLNDTASIIEQLSVSGADLIEIGIPFSDPLADGPVIQHSSNIALKNGMSLNLLLDQLRDIRSKTQIPLILMGYLNPVLQFGMEKFCSRIAEIGIDGLILPDLPPEIYESEYRELFRKNILRNILLVTPSCSDNRIHDIDSLSEGFLYAVSSSSTTGSAPADIQFQNEYFNRLASLNLRNPIMIGFGISSHAHFRNACSFAHGAIIGTAFIRHLDSNPEISSSIPQFIESILNPATH